MINEMDTLEGMRDSDLVSMAKKLFEATVKSTDLLNVGVGEMTVDKVREGKLVLGFLNATNKIMQTKLSVFKMVGLPEKIAAVEARNNPGQVAE